MKHTRHKAHSWSMSWPHANGDFCPGQGWGLLGQGDREGQGHGCGASAEQEPRRIIFLHFLEQYDDPKSLSIVKVTADVYDLNHFSRHLNFAFSPNWSFQSKPRNPFKKLPPKDKNQIKSCMFLIVTIATHCSRGNSASQNLSAFETASLFKSRYDIMLLLARSFTVRSRV